jgi:hypothetical protein
MRKIATLTLLTAALAVTQGCAGTAPQAAAPAPSASPAVTATPSPSISASSAPAEPAASPAKSEAAAISSKRQYFFFPLHRGAEVPESVMAVTTKNRATITADYGDRALFVPVPTTPKGTTYQIRTGKLRTGGEALCLQVQNNGSNPLTLVTKACDTSQKDQLFAFQDNGRDNQGRTTYLIHSDGVYLHYNPDGRYGLIVEESGEGDDLTAWVLVDRGAATLPALD